tara:strand:+ start:1914 stop:2684 length:771 start_codon:yes stop_codon:yes gene_type:complete
MDPNIVKVEAATTDGYITSTNANWATARTATDGGTASGDTDTTAAYLEIKAVLSGGDYIIRRAFMHFSFSSFDVNDISSINIHFGGVAGYVGDRIIFAQSTAFADALSAADFDAMVITASGIYSSDSGHVLLENANTVALNSNAIRDAKANKALQIAVLDFTHDYSNSAPSDTSSVSRITSANSAATYLIVNGAYAVRQTEPAKFINKDEFIVDKYNSDVFGRQFSKNTDQTLFKMGIAGPANLRARNTAYKVTKG